MPQEEKSIIRSKIAPAIVLDDMVLDDIYTGTSDSLTETTKGVKSSKQTHLEVGTDYPHITINSYTFKQTEINKFHIDAMGFLPKLYLKIELVDSSAFKSHGFPKDGDIISVFIRAKNNAFKPVRNDYLVTAVNGGKSNAEGRGGSLELFGELFIPQLHDEIRKAYQGTSFTVLQDICRDLKLGFATNDDFTADEQIWLCPNDTYRNLIEKIVRHTWKDEQSFFDSFIDVYYHLNFININNQLDSDGSLDAAILDTTMFKDAFADATPEIDTQVKTGKLLTDMSSLQGSNMFVRQYRVENNSSQISKVWGYKSYVQFFDQASGKPWEIFVDPLISQGAEESKILLKGRPMPKGADGETKDDWWKTQNKYFWLGIQYRDVHDKYLFAEIWNKRNLMELDKLFIEVDVERWNPNVYRCERLPLILHTQSDGIKRKLDATPEEKQLPASDTTAVLDQFYSGYYMVSGMKFTYSMIAKSSNFAQTNKEVKPSGMVQVMRLTRREWPIPGGPVNQSATVTN